MAELVLRIVKNEPDKRGQLWHYGHFIHDFIVPVIYYLNTANVKYEHIYMEYYTKWSTLGTFRPMAEKILGLKITELNTDKVDNLSVPRTDVSTLSFGPYNPKFFKDIIPYVMNTLTLTESPYKVILIERGKSKSDSVSHIRFLSNHRQLQNRLSRHFGSIFKNVILEELSIDEQVSIFMNADIVIGQHGAGLCNIIWMNKPESLVIEFPPYAVDTFKNMCKAKNFKYKRINPNPIKLIEICQRKMPHIINPV